MAPPAAAPRDADLDTRFLNSCGAGNVREVADFLSAGVSPEATDTLGRTALIRAARAGQTEVIKLLLKDKRTVANASDPREGFTALAAAVRNNRLEAVRALLEDDRVDDRVERNYLDNRGNTALHWACQKGFTEIAKMLAEDPGSDLSLLNEEGLTASFVAKNNGHDEIRKLVLAAEARAKALAAEQARANASPRLERAVPPGTRGRKQKDRTSRQASPAPRELPALNQQRVESEAAVPPPQAQEVDPAAGPSTEPASGSGTAPTSSAHVSSCEPSSSSAPFRVVVDVDLLSSDDDEDEDIVLSDPAPPPIQAGSSAGCMFSSAVSARKPLRRKQADVTDLTDDAIDVDVPLPRFDSVQLRASKRQRTGFEPQSVWKPRPLLPLPLNLDGWIEGMDSNELDECIRLAVADLLRLDPGRELDTRCLPLLPDQVTTGIPTLPANLADEARAISDAEPLGPAKGRRHKHLLHHSACALHADLMDSELAALVSGHVRFIAMRAAVEERHVLWLREATALFDRMTKSAAEGAVKLELSAELKRMVEEHERHARGLAVVKLMRVYLDEANDDSWRSFPDLLRPRGIIRTAASAPRQSSLAPLLSHLSSRSMGTSHAGKLRPMPMKLKHSYRPCRHIARGSMDAEELLFNQLPCGVTCLTVGFSANEDCAPTNLLHAWIRPQIDLEFAVIHAVHDHSAAEGKPDSDKKPCTVYDIRTVRDWTGRPHVVSCGGDGGVFVWPLEEGARKGARLVCRSPDSQAVRIAVRPGGVGDMFAVGFSKGKVQLFLPGDRGVEYRLGLRDRSLTMTWKVPEEPGVTDMAWMRKLLVVGMDISIRVGKRKNYGAVCLVRVNERGEPEAQSTSRYTMAFPVSCLRVSHSGKFLAVGVTPSITEIGEREIKKPSDEVLHIFEYVNAKGTIRPLRRVDTGQQDMNEIVFSRDDRFMVTLCADGVAKIWDFAGLLRAEPVESGDDPATSERSRRTTRAQQQAVPAQTRNWEKSSAEALVAVLDHKDRKPRIKSGDGLKAAAWLRDGVLVIGGEDGRIAFYDPYSLGSFRINDEEGTRELLPFHVLEPGEQFSSITRMAVSDDETFLAVGHATGDVNLYTKGFSDEFGIPLKDEALAGSKEAVAGLAGEPAAAASGWYRIGDPMDTDDRASVFSVPESEDGTIEDDLEDGAAAAQGGHAPVEVVFGPAVPAEPEQADPPAQDGIGHEAAADLELATLPTEDAPADDLPSVSDDFDDLQSTVSGDIAIERQNEAGGSVHDSTFKDVEARDGASPTDAQTRAKRLVLISFGPDVANGDFPETAASFSDSAALRAALEAAAAIEVPSSALAVSPTLATPPTSGDVDADDEVIEIPVFPSSKSSGKGKERAGSSSLAGPPPKASAGSAPKRSLPPRAAAPGRIAGPVRAFVAQAVGAPIVEQWTLPGQPPKLIGREPPEVIDLCSDSDEPPEPAQEQPKEPPAGTEATDRPATGPAEGAEPPPAAPPRERSPPAVVTDSDDDGPYRLPNVKIKRRQKKDRSPTAEVFPPSGL
ncbi:hypothetical protein DFJ74DRAFT_670620 [Hyaloraphidium curvatum]|nr:hypothetical protein DFJ74DRAFT_670620 [Hyaloraphidium curvatum]